MTLANRPVGIFDSGIGGLTVARAIHDLLPHEEFIYFGDTAHLPYGDKSEAAIQAYSIKICNLLLERNCKVIVIACNSASASAFELVKEYVGSRAEVLNVIDPAVDYVSSRYENKQIGLIGTKRTVSSKVYERKVKSLRKNISLKSLATPLLVHMIEEGFYHNNIAFDVVHSYLSNAKIQNIEALILGCTHYPLIYDTIKGYYKTEVEVIDSSKRVAEKLQQTLQEMDMMADHAHPQHQFLVSDFTRSFEKSTKIFFGERVALEHYSLWE